MKRTLQVAILANISRRYDRRVIQGIAAYARDAGNWDLYVLYVEEEPLQRLPKRMRWSGDGMLAAFDTKEVVRAVTGLNLPLVGFGSGYGWYEPDSRIPYFATDNRAIGQLAAEHLLECGFSRLACYGGRSSHRRHWEEDRIQAFRQRAATAGVPCEIFRARKPTAHNWDILRAELTAWLTSLEKPAGLLATTDLRAQHVLQVCRTRQIAVPNEIAVVGVDNDEMICELTTPPLTSIEQGSHKIGYEAAALLDRLMAGRKPRHTCHVIPPEGLIARLSTDVVACNDQELAAAIRFIRQHACDPIRVADVLDAVQVCRSTLERRFLGTLGRTIHSEIERVQVDRAKQLLAGTSLLVKQIAKRCGFRYTQYMTLVFRRCTGQTPLEYRRCVK